MAISCAERAGGSPLRLAAVAGKERGVGAARVAARAVLVALAAVVLLSGVVRGEEEKQKERPAYQILRHNEDWSFLAEAEDEDFFDPIKHIPLNEDGSIWASVGGQLRLRAEAWGDFNFGAPPGADHDDAYLLTRALLHTDVHIGEHVRVFVQGKSAFSMDRDLAGKRRTLDVDELDLQNAFVDLTVPVTDLGRFTLRTGRQELLFGKQRLVSPLDWGNTRRTFEGFSGILKLEDWTVTGFWTRPVPVRKYEFNRRSRKAEFYGVYATGHVPSTSIGLDAYWLGLHRTGITFNGTMGSETRQTVGARVWGKIPDTRFDYDLEAAYQFGDLGSADISAYMVAGELGYKWADAPAKPRVHFGVDYASGDSSAGGRVGTFNHLFPLGHAYLGYIDAVGRQNVLDLRTGISLKPIRKTTVSAEAHYLLRADNDDALYNAGGAAARAGALGSSKEIGVEIDLKAKYQFDRHTSVLLGYSHFFPGDFISESGPAEGVDFGYVAIQYTF